MITDREMFRKASRLSDALEKKVKAGEATPAEVERYSTIVDHCLIWEWAHAAPQPAAELMPPLPAPTVPVPVLRFADWYERNRNRGAWRATDWWAAWLYWASPQPDTDAIDAHEVSAELRRREMHDTPTLRAA